MSSFFESFYECIIADQAFLIILKGAGITAGITLAGLCAGTGLAALLCLMSRCGNPVLRGMEKVYTVIVRGTPVPMLLMLLFYVVFAHTAVSAVTIAIVGFALNSAAYVGEIMKSAVDAVDEGQVKAARTLGFTRWEAFRYVTFPQAVRFARPVYQSTVISTLQWTSVVGYITITDLTRVINNIGARTAKPFFAIFMGISCYLFMGLIVHLAFKLTDRKGERR